jgi:hypothetical protein
VLHSENVSKTAQLGLQYNITNILYGVMSILGNVTLANHTFGIEQANLTTYHSYQP